MLRYEETPPSPALAPFVQALWAFRVPTDAAPVLHHVPPDGCVSLVVARSPDGLFARLCGPRLTSLPVHVFPGDVYHGVRLRPEAAGALTGIAPRAWVDRTAPLGDVRPDLVPSGIDVDAAAEALVGWLGAAAERAPRPDPLVARAVAAIREAEGDVRVEAIARHVGLSVRALQRRFAAATGLTPKQFARVRRFREAVGNTLQPAPQPWGRVAAEQGYADQAHLSREFAALAGASPTEFQVRTDGIDHAGVAP